MDVIPAVPPQTPAPVAPWRRLVRGGLIGLAVLAVLLVLSYIPSCGIVCVPIFPLAGIYVPPLRLLTLLTGIVFENSGDPTGLGLLVLGVLWGLLGVAWAWIKISKKAWGLLAILLILMFGIGQLDPLLNPTNSSCKFVHGTNQWGDLQRQCYETVIQESKDPSQCETLIQRGYEPKYRDQCYTQRFLLIGIKFDPQICATMTDEFWKVDCYRYFPELVKAADCSALEDPLAQRSCWLNKINEACPIPRYTACNTTGQQGVNEYNACVRTFARTVKNPDLCYKMYPYCDVETQASHQADQMGCETYVNTP
jgi:hypothetical protein